jgi:hypothetical protein
MKLSSPGSFFSEELLVISLGTDDHYLMLFFSAVHRERERFPFERICE